MKITGCIAVLLFVFQITACQNHADYQQLKEQTKTKQKVLQDAYQNADTEAERRVVTDRTGDYLFALITDSIFPCWYGTKWDFHGMTQTPGKGSIACGYFVTTILQDIGFDIPRVKWAQAASENVIVKIGEPVKRFHQKPMDDVISYIHQMGDGLYLVGLDCHVGFIYKKKEIMQLVHSSYYPNQLKVLTESLKGYNPLNDSKYRVIGKLLHEQMIIYWLEGKKYE